MGMKNDPKPAKVTLKKKLPTKKTDEKEGAKISLQDQGATTASSSNNWVNDDDLDAL